MAESAAPSGPVLENRYEARQRRQLARLCDPAAVPGDINLGLVQLLPQHGQLGLALLEPVLDVRLELLLAPLGLLECEFVLARVNVCQQLVALDLQLRPPYLEIRLDDLDLVLALADLEFRLGLLEVLLDLLHGKQAVLHGRYALGIIEFEDQVAALRERTGRGELGDLRHHSDIRSGQRQRAHRAELAAQVSLHD